MNVTLKRDGLTLRGELLKPDVEKCPILIIFHGFMANIGKDDKSMFYQIAQYGSIWTVTAPVTVNFVI